MATANHNFNPERAEKKAEATAAEMTPAQRRAAAVRPLDLEAKPSNLPALAPPIMHEAEAVEVEIIEAEAVPNVSPVSVFVALDRDTAAVLVRVFVAAGMFGAVLFVGTVALDIAAAVRPVIARGAADIAAAACQATAALVQMLVWVLGLAAVGAVLFGAVGSLVSAQKSAPKNALADIEARRRTTRTGNDTGRPVEINIGKIEVTAAKSND